MADTTATDDFDLAITEVSDDVVQIEREVIAYQVAPKGTHQCLCVDAKMVDVAVFQYEGKTIPATRKLQLTWQLNDETYDDEKSGEKRNFRVFDRLSIAFGNRAKLPKVFKELTDLDIDMLKADERFEKGGKKMIRTIFVKGAFVGMEADVLIKLKESKKEEGRFFANVGDYTCDEKLQEKNASTAKVAVDQAKA